MMRKIYSMTMMKHPSSKLAKVKEMETTCLVKCVKLELVSELKQVDPQVVVKKTSKLRVVCNSQMTTKMRMRTTRT